MSSRRNHRRDIYETLQVSLGDRCCGAGLSGLVTDYKAYQRWVKTAYDRAQFVEVMLSTADMQSEARDGRKHKDHRPAKVKKGEKLVNKTVDAVKSFINPFDVHEDAKLYLKPKVTLHCYYIYLFWVLVGGILNVFNSY